VSDTVLNFQIIHQTMNITQLAKIVSLLTFEAIAAIVQIETVIGSAHGAKVTLERDNFVSN
jgi:hypothetical protein